MDEIYNGPPIGVNCLCCKALSLLVQKSVFGEWLSLSDTNCYQEIREYTVQLYLPPLRFHCVGGC
jgi:hypothetical protein